MGQPIITSPQTTENNIQTLLENALTITKVYPRKKDNKGEDDMVLTVEVGFNGAVDLAKTAFLFSVIDPNDTEKFLSPVHIIPGLWDDQDNPVSDDTRIAFSAEFENCTVEIFEKLADKKASTNELIGEFRLCKVGSFSFSPGYGHTVDLSFSALAIDVESAYIGGIAEKIKGGVYVKVSRMDLFDHIQQGGEGEE